MGAARKSSQSSLTDFLQKYESEISTLLGVLVVIVLAVGLFLLIRRSNQTNVPQISDLAQTTQEDLMSSPRPGTYTVQAGDGLWSIAQAQLGDGYRWSEIAQANDLVAPYTLTAGQELVLPESAGTPSPSAPAAIALASPQAPSEPTTPAEPTAPAAPQDPTTPPDPTLDPTSVPEASMAPEAQTTPDEEPTITGSSYTVVTGDSLWKIAVAAYNDGYKWVEIYQANRDSVGANPGIIHPGQVLTLPGK